MPAGDGAGTPVCIDDLSGLLVAGCDVTITADEIDPTTVQKRVTGACAPGSLVSAINEDGSVVCEPDIDTVLSEGQVDSFVANNGYGDIMGVTTAPGSGLTGGTESGTAALSVSGVTSAMITDGTIVGSDINPDTTITADDFIYSSSQIGYILLSPMTCIQTNASTGSLDRDIYFRSPGGNPINNSHGPFVMLRSATAVGAYFALCRANIQVPPASNLRITGATLFYSDPSTHCLVGGTLKAKQLPSNINTTLAAVYSGDTDSDVSTAPGYNKTKPFPRFDPYTLTQTATEAGEVFFEVKFQQTLVDQSCRFIGVQLTYDVDKP
jgi:hypothetical protein